MDMFADDLTIFNTSHISVFLFFDLVV